MARDNAFSPVGDVQQDNTVDESAEAIGSAPDRPVAEPAKVEADPDSYTHYVHLADGRVLRANLTAHTDTLGSRYYEGEGDNESSVPIIGVYSR